VEAAFNAAIVGTPRPATPSVAAATEGGPPTFSEPENQAKFSLHYQEFNQRYPNTACTANPLLSITEGRNRLDAELRTFV